MSDLLFPYYERELRYIHQLMQEFRRDHSGAADRLRIDPGGSSSDANVERLLQSFALLGGRAHAKIDDDYPELTDALLQVLYPHFLAPIPSMFIVQFDPDPTRTQMPEGCLIERGSVVYTTVSDPVPCRFRTTYPVTLWPVRLAEARFQPPPFPAGITAPPGAAAVLRLKFECQTELQWSQLQIDKLRFYLHGDAQLTGDLYEALFRNAIQVMYRPATFAAAAKQEPLIMPSGACIEPVGFQEHEGLLPYGPHAHMGYRLLTELFTFPLKFQFFDLAGWRHVGQGQFDDACEVLIFFDSTNRRLEQGVSVDSLRMGCTPVVNLFEKVAEPIKLRPLRHEYHIVPDHTNPHALEVYAVDHVESVDPAMHSATAYAPFHSLKHEREPGALFWHAQRRRSLEQGDRGTEVYLSLTNLHYEPRWPEEEVLNVRTWCTNRDLPMHLAAEGGLGELRLEMPAPVQRVRSLQTPTPSLRPPVRRGSYWRIISHLSPNFLSLQQPAEALLSLRELLQLYDFSDPVAGQQHLAAQTRLMIDGILGVSSRRVLGRVPGAAAQGLCRGVEVTVRFDREKYARTGVLLFASVLEHFFTLYATTNSFTQLAAYTRESVIKKWPPRAGAVALL